MSVESNLAALIRSDFKVTIWECVGGRVCTRIETNMGTADHDTYNHETGADLALSLERQVAWAGDMIVP